ncbi:MAG TPA: phosphatidate cytidylyltransferase [Tepidisphaeraceae bacterium]|jgi:phosphatidate cytidylyltransferase
MIERSTVVLTSASLGVLTIGTVAGEIARRCVKSESGRKTADNLVARVRAWWVMVAIFAVALACGLPGVVILFALVSFLALREVLTLTRTRRGDHHTLFWAFFVALPLQYGLIWGDWYGLFSILIPVYGFLFFAIRSALAGDVTRYLERAAKVYWGVMICVYCLSHVPALMVLHIPGYGTRRWELLAFLVIVVQMSDVLQYCWGKTLGKHKVVPKLSPSKTWEGLIGGILTAALLGMAMTPITPFRWWQAGLLSLLICVMGFFGGLVASAIKRDSGVKDYGQLIEGHGGMMDRVDSLAFAAPVFFHVVRYAYGV